MAYIEMKHSYKRYQTGDTEIIANNDINFAIEKRRIGHYFRGIRSWKINCLKYSRWYGHER